MEKTERRRTRLPAAARFVLRQLLYLGAGFLLARTRLFDGLPSFAIAVAAGAPPGCLFSACAGAAAGSVVFAPDLLTGLTGTAAVLACGTICFALRAITGTPGTARTSFLVAFLCCAAAGVTTLLAGGFYTGGVLLYLCDGILAGGAAYFFVQSEQLRPVLRRAAIPNDTEMLSLVSSACVLLLCAASWSVYVFVPSRAAAAALVLLCAYLFGYAGGAAGGVLCGTAMEIACGPSGLTCCFALGGLLAGLCSRHGRWLQSGALTLTAGLYALLMQQNAAVAVCAETALICALFCAVPESALRWLRRRTGAGAASEDPASAALRRRLQTVSRAVSDITPYLSAQQLRQGAVPGTKRMTERVRELACDDCAGRALCWGENEAQVRDALAQSFLMLHRKQYLSPEALPDPTGKSCVRRNMLTAACVQAYEESARSPYAAQLPAADPFFAASDLLSDAAEQAVPQRRRLPRESSDAGQIFRTHGVPVHAAACCIQSGRFLLTATSDPFPQQVNKAALTEALGRACGCSFALPTVTADGTQFRWRFVQTVQFRLRTGAAQTAADGRFCGDYYLTFAQDGKQIFLLCDGMGTGRAAAADAQTAAEILASLLKADVSFPCAFRMLNAALLLREDTESVCTVDAVCVDLYTGQTTFYKAGAAASYLLLGGKTDRVDTPCLPAGILPDVTLAQSSRTLRKGDVFVLVSDGTCALRDKHILDALRAFRGDSAQKLAEAILAGAQNASRPARTDDATVLAVVAE
ncbi:MAG: SpoIIE family protein phosphatase [Clostridia bacterium]|nr:SpoIIE family protein phosphatase [Clostridia bacterium]